MSKPFDTIVVCDFEFEIADGELPNVLCMVAHELNANLQPVRPPFRVWRGEFGSTPPFDIGPNSLFVAYSAQAELTCFMTLGWQFPIHVFDLHTAYLAASNLLLPYDPDEVRKRERKRLSDACRAYGIEGWENLDKEQMQKDIGEGRWHIYGKPAVLDYCAEDVKKSAELLGKMLIGSARFPAADVPRTIHWSDYSAKTVAQIQARGMHLDMALWNAAQEYEPAVVRALIARLDPSQGSDTPIYTPEGEWCYARFEQWLVARGVATWPRLDSGSLNIDGDAFRMMYHEPGIEELHALRNSLGVIVRAKLPIGHDGRNRPSLFPFNTVTGRNAHAKSLFNAHAGMRSFMIAPPGKTMVYLDWRTQEVGVAAARSGDQALLDDYRNGDIYHALADLCGLTNDPDPKHWAKDNPAMRQRMKPLQLGINYGMGVPSLARGLNRHPLIASTIIERHRRRYPRFWEWRADMVQHALLARRIESGFGWPLRISTSPNQRTLYNFPMQGGGADMLRLAAWRLCEAGIIPVMLVHDGILFEEEDLERIEHAAEIMLQAGRDVCDGFEIDVTVDQRLAPGARYRDKRPVAKKMWDVVMSTLVEVGAISERTRWAA